MREPDLALLAEDDAADLPDDLFDVLCHALTDSAREDALSLTYPGARVPPAGRQPADLEAASGQGSSDKGAKPPRAPPFIGNLASLDRQIADLRRASLD